MTTPQNDADERAKLEAQIEEIRQRYKPLPFIPYDCNPYLLEEPKLAYYGYAVTEDELYAFGERHGLCPVPKDKNLPEFIRRIEVYEAAVELLGAIVRFPLELHCPINPDQRLSVTLYSNYAAPVQRLPDEDEQDVIDTIADELNLPEDREALWHYDSFAGEAEMRLKPWEEPSDNMRREMMKMYEEWGHDCDQDDLSDD